MAAAKKPVKKAVAKKAVAKKAVAKKAPKRSKWALEQDLRFKAKKAGKRVSAEGNTYTETRPNRSDASRRNKI
jgi:hypothetical protein